jgi:hypothetical protein
MENTGFEWKASRDSHYISLGELKIFFIKVNKIIVQKI